MLRDQSLVSIVVPMFNAEKFISATLESILCEMETPLEVIVVNDRSTDRSLDRVDGFRDARLRVIDGGGLGAAHAMNVGFSNARGAILMFCDSDDLYPEGRIRQQVEWLRAHPDHDGICGIFSTIDRKGKLVANMQTGDTTAEISGELVNGKLRTSLCTYAVRSTLIQKVGWFREFFEAGYDLDYQLRLGEAGRIAYVPENYYFYRLHASSMTHTQSNAMRNFFEQTALELQRQRRTSGSDDLQRDRPPSKPSFDRSPTHSAIDHIQEQLISRAWREHGGGRKASALRTGGRALLANPLNARVWKSVLALIVK
jgi:glycosyltransferase involved in cell wall biosynthesis